MFAWLKNFGKIERSRRLSIIFGTMIVVGLILVALGIMATIKVTPYATYTNKGEGFLIKFPAYWQPFKVTGVSGAIISFISPKENELDNVQENVNVAIKVLPREMTMERLSQIIVSQVTGTFGEQVDITQSIPISLGGKKGYRMTFVGYGKNIPNPLLYVTAWTAVGDRVYIVTFTGLQKSYPLYEKKVNEIIRSFKLIPIETQ
jgi:hypothetical protein